MLLPTYTNHFKFQIFYHFTFQVFILGNVFTKGIIFIQSMIRDKIWGEKFKKKFKSIKHKKTSKLSIVMIEIIIITMIIIGFGL